MKLPTFVTTQTRDRTFRFDDRLSGEAYALGKAGGAQVTVKADGRLDESYTAEAINGSDAFKSIHDSRFAAALRGDVESLGEHWSTSEEEGRRWVEMAQPEPDPYNGKIYPDSWRKTRQTLFVEGNNFVLETPTTKPHMPYLIHSVEGTFEPKSGAVALDSITETLHPKTPDSLRRHRVQDIHSRQRWLMDGVNYYED